MWVRDSSTTVEGKPCFIKEDVSAVLEWKVSSWEQISFHKVKQLHCRKHCSFKIVTACCKFSLSFHSYILVSNIKMNKDQAIWLFSLNKKAQTQSLKQPMNFESFYIFTTYFPTHLCTIHKFNGHAFIQVIHIKNWAPITCPCGTPFITSCQPKKNPIAWLPDPLSYSSTLCHFYV